MKSQEMRGKIQKVKVRIEEAAGILTGNDALESEGSRERSRGSAEEKLGRARRKVGELLEGVAESIRE